MHHFGEKERQIPVVSIGALLRRVTAVQRCHEKRFAFMVFGSGPSGGEGWLTGESG